MTQIVSKEFDLNYVGFKWNETICIVFYSGRFDLNYVGFKFMKLSIVWRAVIGLIWTMWDLNALNTGLDVICETFDLNYVGFKFF